VTNWSPFGTVSASDGSWSPMTAEVFDAKLRRSHPQYRVVLRVGHGGMGAVYAAEDDGHGGRRVAIKMLRPDRHYEAFTRRFDAEIVGLTGLRHPNIVSIYEAGVTADGYRFFVMEYLEGETLEAALSRPARLPLPRIASIMADLCAAADHAHRQGWVHRDIKASNVMLVLRDSRAVLIDFGIARDMTAARDTLSRQQAPGTYGHIAPELLRGEPPTPAADVFSLGVVLYQMLTGEIPGIAHSLPSAFGLDRRFDAVVMDALRPEPSFRYRTAAGFAEAIAAAVSGQPIDGGERSMIEAASSSRSTLKPTEAAASGGATASSRTQPGVTIPPPAAAQPVEFAGSASLAGHRAFFAAYGAEERAFDRLVLQPDEKWTVEYGGDASHAVPKRYDGQTVNTPSLVAWSRDGRRLFTAADALGISAFWQHGGAPYGQDVHPGGHGNPRRFFVSQYVLGSERVLLLTDFNGHKYYKLYDGWAHCAGEGWETDLWFGMQFGTDSSLNATVGFDPWRPGGHHELAVTENFHDLKLLDVRDIEGMTAAHAGRVVRTRHRFLNEMSEMIRELWPSRSDRPKRRWTAFDDWMTARWLTFSNLGDVDNVIHGFVWHPSGQYLAVNTGAIEDPRHRRIHIVHPDSAEIVASITSPSAALAWSPNGRYLLFKRWTTAPGGTLAADAGVWDAACFAPRLTNIEDLLDQPWARRGLHSAPLTPGKFGPCDTALSEDGMRMLVDDATAIAAVIREGCEIRRGEIVARIAEEPYAHAAWSPTDPHVFATVGGKASKDDSDLYPCRGHKHGRFLKIWRLATAR
jgi:serine/threonine protein kinase